MKIKVLYALFFIIVSLCICTAYAGGFYDISFTDCDGFVTKIEDTKGNVHTFDGFIDSLSMENSADIDKIASYRVLKNNEVLINVTLRDILNKKDASLMSGNTLNGYYQVTFELSKEENTEAFITGLTPENLQKVQNEIISSSVSGKDFKIEDVDFIDTEKALSGNYGDSLLCWAATSSNLLHYTGWSKNLPNVNTADDVFELFINNFNDNPGNSYYAFDWFINGTYKPQSWSDWAHVKDYKNSGGYFSDYESSKVTKYVFDKHLNEYFPFDSKLLREGYGFSISVGWLNSYGTRVGGHVISCWGYIYDKDYKFDNPNYYKALIVSDSDNDAQGTSDRRQAPNTLAVLNMSHYEQNNYDAWYFDNYNGVFEGYQIIFPYSDELPMEKSSMASKNKFEYPDIVSSGISVTTDSYTGLRLFKKYYSHEPMYIKKKFSNTGGATYSGNLSSQINIVNQNTGATVLTYSGVSSNNIASFSSYTNTQEHKLNNPPAGKYTLTYTQNKSKEVEEAYYYNNEYKYDFEVVDRPDYFSSSPFTAEIGGFKNGEATVTFSYGNFEKYYSNPNSYLKIFKSIYKNSAWSDYEEIEYIDEGTFHKKTIIPADGEKIKFCYYFYMDDETIGLYKSSPHYTLSYADAALTIGAGNTFYPEGVLYNDKKLCEGQNFEFKVNHTFAGYCSSDTYDTYLYAVKDNEKTLLYKSENNISTPSESEKIFTVNSWENELHGEYEIYAEIEGSFESKSILLARLQVSEKHGFHVNTDYGGTNFFDDKISLADAVIYLKQYGTENDIITIDPSLNINLTTVISIDTKITIDGNGAYAASGLTIFSVKSSGSLSLKNMRLHGNNSGNSTGISISGGAVDAENIVFGSFSNTFGTAVYSTEGSFTAKNCTFRNCSSYQGIIYSKDNSCVNLLNCVFYDNSSKNIIYTEASDANVIYSTFVNNKILSSGASVYSDGTSSVNVIGSIINNNSNMPDANEGVKLIGCYVGSFTDSEVDLNTEISDAFGLFYCNEEGNVIKDEFKNDNLAGVKLRPSSLVQRGVMVKNKDGKISYSYDNEVYINTEIESSFSDDDYTKDMYGKSHNFLTGADSSIYDAYEMNRYSSKNIVIFAPREKRATFIERITDINGNLSDISYKKVDLNCGTNVVPLSCGYILNKSKYMLWDGENALSPVISPGKSE